MQSAMNPLLILLLFLHLCCSSLGLNQDGQNLLLAKAALDDPNAHLADWNARDLTPCNWTGVTCASTSNSTVTSIDLTNFGLAGNFPPSFCLLPNLSSLILVYNNLNSTLPPSSLLNCSSLTHLDLSLNLLVGDLPDSLADLPSLTHLDLTGNNFSGEIPPSFGRFPRLQNLVLVNNLIASQIPPFLGNISTLRQLNLSYNPFAPGPIPAAFGNLSALENLWLAGCGLVGSIPDSLGRLSALTNLDVSRNSISGPIPKSLTALKSVVQIELFHNSISGEIPAGFSNLSSLRRIDASMNQLTGAIPDDVYNIRLLDSLHLYQNNLTGGIPELAAVAPNLVELRLFQNQLNGSLPASLGKNSPIEFLDLSDNSFSGEIPAGICDRGSLQDLLLIGNSFSGSIPDGLGRCQTLRRVRLPYNLLSGEVPDGLWGLPHLSLLELTGNSFSGEISPVIAGAANLSNLLISGNRFTGIVPPEIGMLSKLYEFSAADNLLMGPLPSSLGSLEEIGQLDLHNNSLSGELLQGIKSWKKLTELNLADNNLSGEIPTELGSLPVLNYLDLSSNALSGDIPIQLQNLKLNQFNLSNNQLSGQIPPLYSTAAYRDSFLGNPGLCGDSEGLCPGSRSGGSGHKGVAWMLRSIFILAAVILAAGIAWFYWRYRNFKKSKLGADKSKWILTSFHKLGFNEYEILDCLDEDNVIGSGASGKVYKAVLSSGETVAVKKLWGASKKGGHISDDAFEAEVSTLGKIRHKNIVKLWCCCAYKDCQLLVYEYMPNGSLGDLLHSGKSSLLDWATRYKIALEAAEGLSYLHHDCVPPIVHRDIKSNNILLDAEFGARVADFGVAKSVEMVGKAPNTSMSVIAGSRGYIAPEYAYTLRVNEKSDIYSFGVVIIELVTGRLPVDPEFGEKDLVKWVCGTLEQKGVDHIIDPKLDISSFREEICRVLNIGLLCTSSLPINRPSMRRVVKMLQEASFETDSKGKPLKDGKLSPYYYEDASDHGSIV